MLRTGIIGYGKVGRRRHNLLKTHKSYTISGICDIDKAAVVGCNDYKQMLDDYSLDCVFVCVPHTITTDVVVDALNHGIHVFAEKPPGCSLDDVFRMKKALDSHPECKLLFGFNHRYHEHVQKALEVIRSGELGKLYWMRGQYGKVELENWRSNKKLGGRGILLSQGIHMVDLMRFLGEVEFTEIQSMCSHFNGKWYEDNVFLNMRADNGITAQMHSSSLMGKNQFHIFFGLSKGYLHLDGLISSSMSFGIPEKLNIAWKKNTKFYGNPAVLENFYGPKDISWKVEVDNFARIIEKDLKEYPCGIYDALEVMKILEEVYKDDKY